jgi:hypothetical protein
LTSEKEYVIIVIGMIRIIMSEIKHLHHLFKYIYNFDVDDSMNMLRLYVVMDRVINAWARKNIDFKTFEYGQDMLRAHSYLHYHVNTRDNKNTDSSYPTLKDDFLNRLTMNLIKYPDERVL